jgi:predicted HNH restriction endonuclease
MMGKKLKYTPNSRIRACLRQLFMRSRERAACLKAAGNCCESCGVKASKANGREVDVFVHHKDGIENWDALFKAVREFLLCDPKNMECLCKKCHEEKHKEEK